MDELETSDRLLRPADVAERIGIPVGTLANWRCDGRGPRYLKVGRHVRYRAADLETWLDRQTVKRRSA
jgi:predicted DNA-binding transcriptional regulator AlpA